MHNLENIEDIERAVREDSFTHPNEVVWEACTAYCLAIHSLINYQDIKLAYKTAK